MTGLPEAVTPFPDRASVLLAYLDHFRARVLEKVGELPAADRARSHVPSGWTPLQLAVHLLAVERRWLEWGFEGTDVGDPWSDERDGRWHTDADLDAVRAAAGDQAVRTAAVVRRHALDEVGAPGERWRGRPPATLERVLLHLIQEYARHLGQLDVVVELATGRTGE